MYPGAFAATTPPGHEPVEVGLITALRDSNAWLPAYSLVAVVDGEIIGHCLCTRAHVANTQQDVLLNPRSTMVPGGVYPVAQVHNDGSIEIAEGRLESPEISFW